MTADPSIFFRPPARSTAVPEAPARPRPAAVELAVDGRPVVVPDGSTVLDACSAAGVETPTLCHLPTLEPVNACRLCVVEVAGSRVLVPACSRKVEAGMDVRTDTPRVRQSRRIVLELLASAVDLSLAGSHAPDGGLARWMDEYGADPGRFGPSSPAGGPGERDGRGAGHHHRPDGATAETVAQPTKVDNDLYVRDYTRCILCYKCVEACGVDAQNTFAIAVAGRGFDARISTEWDVGLPGSACVYCGNCIAACPTGALMFRSEHEMRLAGTWDESAQTTTDTICPYCGVGCTLTLTVQEDTIVRVLSPLDNDVTHGNLCVKGRFGLDFMRDGGDGRTGG